MKKSKQKKPVDPKVAFRRSQEWKTFRNKVKKSQKVDPVTGTILSKGFNLHHLDLDPSHYTDISKEENFIGLNSQTHEVIHWFFGDSKNKKDWKKRIEKVIEILKLMEELNK